MKMVNLTFIKNKINNDFLDFYSHKNEMKFSVNIGTEIVAQTSLSKKKTAPNTSSDPPNARIIFGAILNAKPIRSPE